MMFRSYPSKPLAHRLDRLKASLAEEHPLLVDVVKTYLELDRVGYGLGLLGADQSYATRISWWPFVAVLGTFSAGKSTFINEYTGINLQDIYNLMLAKGWTLGSAQGLQFMHGVIRLYHGPTVRLLEKYWKDAQPDLLTFTGSKIAGPTARPAPRGSQ